jgi:hypothetical protein
MLGKPDVWRMFEHTHHVWTELMTDPETNLLLDEGAIVLQPPADTPLSAPTIQFDYSNIISIEGITDAAPPSSCEEDECEEGTEDGS